MSLQRLVGNIPRHGVARRIRFIAALRCRSSEENPVRM